LQQSYEDAVNGIHHYTKVAMAQSQAAANVAAIEEAIVASAKRGDAVNEDIAKRMSG
jgi:hypothetical protein